MRRRLARLTRRKAVAGYWGHTDRQGSVLLVVIGLLLLLMVIGFTFFTFANQEHSSAEFYSDAMKVYQDSGIDSDVFFDFALRQYIVGPNDITERQSALWPGRHALVPNALGMFTSNASGEPKPIDRHPFNGYGLNIIDSGTGDFVVDQDFDNVADTTPNVGRLIDINQSQLAVQLNLARGDFLNPTGSVPQFPTIDVGYTYPDINNVFLAYIGTEPSTSRRIFIPSFHRPMTLRQSGLGVPYPDWYQNANTTTRVMRPHPYHTIPGTSYYRFLSALTPPAMVGLRQIMPFPFAVDNNVNGIAGEQGVITNVTTDLNLDYDVDADKDSIREAIWLDLGFPMQTLPDGRNFVPLFAATIMEADGLVNLNVAGNMAGLTNLVHTAANPFGGQNKSLSRSNMALSPSEINPHWALTADASSNAFLVSPNVAGNPAPELQPYRGFFGLSNTDSNQYVIDRVALANMDLLALLWGRPKYSVSMAGPNEVYSLRDLVEGRWGESGQLYQGVVSGNLQSFPRPGQPNVDDDLDASEVTNIADNGLGNVFIPAGRTPIDYDGSGSYLFQDATNGFVATIAGPGIPGSPLRWNSFTSYQTGTPYSMAFSGLLAPSANSLGLNDFMYRDVDEMMVDRRYKQTYGASDQLFGPDEIAALQMSTADYKARIGSSRLWQLAPFNFQDNLQAQSIRQRFTTESWDRREHGFRENNSRNWEYNADADSDGFLEFPPIIPGLAGGAFDAAQPIRKELRAAIATERRNSFVPTTIPGANAPWPQWRLNINRLLTCQNANTFPGQLPHQFGPLAGSPSYAPQNPLLFRHLTPHADDPGSATIPTSAASFPPFSGQPTPAVQEYWARRDRQLLARDIYVLLYLLGGGDDTQNYTNSNARTSHPVTTKMYRPLYSEAQLQEMAQFAVNYVDALDPDDVITMFEYDKNLADGWNLDDNAYLSSGDSTATGDRGVVFGVEAQQLTINEALVVQSKRVPRTGMAGSYRDHPATRFDDSTQDRYYTYIELANVSPYNVAIYNQGWEIAVDDVATGTDSARLILADSSVQNILPGTKYTIGSRTYVPASGTDDSAPGVPYNSALMVDTTWTPVNPNVINYQQIAPATSLNLDLVESSGNYRYILSDNGGTGLSKGLFLDLGTDPILPRTINFVLRRRLHPYRTPPSQPSSGQPAPPPNSAYELDNPWVEVDRFSVDLVEANLIPSNDPAITVPMIQNLKLRDPSDPVLAGNPSANDLIPKVSKLRSVERRQPLTKTDWDVHSIAVQANSLGMENQQATLANDQLVWQPRFDRDFTSVVDLLSIPLYGPTRALDKLSYNRRLVAEVFQPGVQFEPRVAQARFLRADFPDSVATTGSTNFVFEEVTYAQRGLQSVGQVVNASATNYDVTGDNLVDINDQRRLDNRWHRVLELLEVPPRSNMILEKNYANLSNVNAYANRVVRRPGKINLNGMRHQQVYSALLDDPNTFLITNGSDFIEGNARPWWNQFLITRDGFDLATNLVLPGSPVSRPFRDLGAVDNGIASIERTLVRRLMQDNEDLNNNGVYNYGEDGNGNSMLDPAPYGATGQRQLFEARIPADLPLPTTPGEAKNKVDYQTRHRLLAKVANNSTNRSHVFYIWLEVGFFEAFQPDPVGFPNVAQIGAEMTDQPRRRGFFVVDRSLLEDAYDPQTGTFDFKKFIQFRKTIE